ncbi:MAG TPA: [acyl-carrier-protein] S-malonyltransferase [Lentisphaeria bacterium]|nr:MAG: [acyl-carrier-protein] S-malonyltransferase [Lentisphaerae bacterium GWF2_38_69]HBM17492.1 [acyl-carrier-protein] S-malonyltransferase [Lentisphaeria bacterium]
MKFGFVFSGQGAQAVGMGKDLFDQVPAAAEIFKRADQALGWSISEVCFNGPDTKLTETRYCQPAIYVMSVACLEAFRQKFPVIKAEATAGLSLGEFTALYAAGAFTFEDGLKILEKRAAYMQEACLATKGTMASIMKSELSVIKECCQSADADVANINCSGQIVISGEEAKIQAAVALLKEKGAKAIPLKVAGAYHSRLMKSAEEKLGAYLTDISLTTPSLPVAQNFIGKLEKDPQNLKANIIKQITGSVQWIDCVNSMAAIGIDTIIEFGPGNVLTGLVKKIKADMITANINSVATLEAYK